MALRGLLLYLNNQFAQCISHLQAALRLDPEHSGARILLRKARDIERIKDEGNKAFKLGQLTGSVGKYTEALDVSDLCHHRWMTALTMGFSLLESAKMRLRVVSSGQFYSRIGQRLFSR